MYQVTYQLFYIHEYVPIFLGINQNKIQEKK